MSISQSLLIGLFCMFVVFVVLIALWAVIRLFSVVIMRLEARREQPDVH